VCDVKIRVRFCNVDKYNMVVLICMSITQFGVGIAITRHLWPCFWSFAYELLLRG